MGDVTSQTTYLKVYHVYHLYKEAFSSKKKIKSLFSRSFSIDTVRGPWSVLLSPFPPTPVPCGPHSLTASFFLP